MTNRKIIVKPCMVKIWLYWSAFSSVLLGFDNCDRISSASQPPSTKNRNADSPYMIPIFLWSTVVNQLQKPSVAIGRRRIPFCGVTVTVAIGRSSLLGQAIEVGHQVLDLLFGQVVVRHLRAELDRVRVLEPRLQGREVRVPVDERLEVAPREALVRHVAEVGQVRGRRAHG